MPLDLEYHKEVDTEFKKLRLDVNKMRSIKYLKKEGDKYILQLVNEN